tara:strand:- start:199 stop:858 length:660 start_codon:yes stop_codon:yes gene_type:complete
MSNKKILEEATIRRFMKLASIDKLSENFLDTVQEEEKVEEASDTTAETVEEEKEIEEGQEEAVEESKDETVEEGADAEEVTEAAEETVEEATEEVAETVDEEVSLPEEDDLEGGEEPEAMDMGADDAAPAAEADVAAALRTIADALGAAGIDIEVKDDGEDLADEPEVDMGDEPADEDPMQQEASEEVAEERLSEDDEFLESVANKVLQRIRETLKKSK